MIDQVFQKGLGKLRAEYDIKLQPEHIPYAITIPRRVPVPLRKKVKQELDRMETQGEDHTVQPECRSNTLPSVDQVLAQLAGAKIPIRGSGKFPLPSPHS